MSEDLSTGQVAERFGVTPANVRVWCRRGLLPNAYEQATPRGPVWLIPSDDLEGFEPPKKTGRPPKPKPEPAPSSDGKVVVKPKRAAKKGGKR